MCLIYIDDVIVYFETTSEHVGHLDTVLTLLRDDGVSLKVEKCLFQPLTSYFGQGVESGRSSVA